MQFKDMTLSLPILRAIEEKGYQKPSPIQAQAIPAILKNSDLLASAQTGTGKTAGFTLPMLEILSKKDKAQPKMPKALILAPTRELAAQIHESLLAYGKHLDLRCAMIYGGVKIPRQIEKLAKGVDILVATPGRLLDLHHQKAVFLNKIEILVLDEADRMLDMGFIHDIKKITQLMPAKRQNLLFSATFSTDIRKLAKGLLNHPVEINIAPETKSAITVEHKLHPVDKAQKTALLSHLIQQHNWFQALVFSRTKHGANKLVKNLLDDKINAAAIHGNKSQAQRTKALDDFKKGKVQILVATDIAARGIDIQQLPQVVNFDLPDVPEDYVHRIGRTGRAGASGNAISLVCADEIKQLIDIEKVLKKTIKREYVEGFEPKHELPEKAPRKPTATKARPEQKSPTNSRFSIKKNAPQKGKGRRPSGASNSRPKNPNNHSKRSRG